MSLWSAKRSSGQIGHILRASEKRFFFYGQHTELGDARDTGQRSRTSGSAI
jgi:hypothetical protein